MGWDTTRSTVNDQWGQGPALVLGLHAELSLPAEHPWRAVGLTAAGGELHELPVKASKLQISPDQRSAWWLLTRP